MTERDKIAILIFSVGAAASVAWAYMGVTDVLRRVAEPGGLAFGSTDLFGLLGSLIPVIVAFWLSSRLRDRGKTEQILREVHRFGTLALVAMFLLFMAQILDRQVLHRADGFAHGLIGWWSFVGTFFAGALWLPFQGLCIAGFVGLLVKGHTSTDSDNATMR